MDKNTIFAFLLFFMFFLSFSLIITYCSLQYSQIKLYEKKLTSINSFNYDLNNIKNIYIEKVRLEIFNFKTNKFDLLDFLTRYVIETKDNQFYYITENEFNKIKNYLKK